jgi:ATP-dependent Clp protease adaptor protein ClpS
MVHPSTPTPTTTPVSDEEVEQRPETLWRLVLLDDNEHTYEYVIEMLGTVFGYGTEKSFALARIVDTEGRVTLMTAARDACELKQAQVHAYGADPRIPSSKGSMTAIVEPLDEAMA